MGLILFKFWTRLCAYLTLRTAGYWRRKWMEDLKSIAKLWSRFEVCWTLCLNLGCRSQEVTNFSNKFYSNDILTVTIDISIFRMFEWNKLWSLLLLSLRWTLFSSIVIDGKNHMLSIKKRNCVYFSLYKWWNSLWNSE